MTDALYGETLGAGALVGRWEIEEQVGRGGFAAVYRARDSDGVRVAIKVMHSAVATATRNLRRFGREARAIASLTNPHVVEVIETGCLDDGRPYLVTGWIDGEDLGTWIEQRGAMLPAEIVEVVRQIGDGLAAAHRIGIVHRDLKPQNVIGSEVDGRLTLRLIDFGIVKLVDTPEATALTTAGAIGSPATMAPEQLRGAPVDARTDVYGLGAVMFYLAAGRMPFIASDVGVLEHLHLTTPPPRLSTFVNAPAWLEDAIARCLAKDPAGRFPSVAALIADLEAGLARSQGCPRGPVLRLQAFGDGDELDELIEDAIARLEGTGATLAFETGDGLCGFWRGEDAATRRCAIEVARALVGPMTAVSLDVSALEDRGELSREVLALERWPGRAGELDLAPELAV